jgi:hypothetical protein
LKKSLDDSACTPQDPRSRLRPPFFASDAANVVSGAGYEATGGDSEGDPTKSVPNQGTTRAELFRSTNLYISNRNRRIGDEWNYLFGWLDRRDCGGAVFLRSAVGSHIERAARQRLRAGPARVCRLQLITNKICLLSANRRHPTNLDRASVGV